MRARRGCAVASAGSLLSLCAASSSKSRTVDISANMTHQYLAMQVRGPAHASRLCSQTVQLSKHYVRVPPIQDDMHSQIDNKEAKILELQDALQLSRRGTP